MPEFDHGAVSTHDVHGAPGGPTVACDTSSRGRPVFGRVVRMPCGCTYDDTRWLTYCQPVAEAQRAIAAHWAADRDPLLA